MQVSQSLHHFIKNRLDLILCHGAACLLRSGVDLQKICLQIIEYHVQLTIGEDNFLQFDDIGMIEFAQRFYLSQCAAFIPIFIFLFHFFYCYYFVIWADCLEYYSECAIAECSSYLVLLHLYRRNIIKCAL